jgi:hypothetical protein
MDIPEILAAAELRALRPDRPARSVSANVARQMLHLLGDNPHWTEIPTADELLIWTAIRSGNEAVRAELAAYYPQQVEAFRHAYKSWGHQWLRDIVEAEGNLDTVAELAQKRRLAREAS